MGQQQLLLIVLGVIVVGIAVVVGINLFNANAESSTQDSIVSQCTNLGAMAQQYFKKPTSMGGGGGHFTGFENTSIPQQLLTSTDATLAISSGDQTCSIVGTPTDVAYATNWTVTCTVTPTGMTSVVN
jgi:hypothetical protein